MSVATKTFRETVLSKLNNKDSVTNEGLQMLEQCLTNVLHSVVLFERNVESINAETFNKYVEATFKQDILEDYYKKNKNLTMKYF